MKFEKTVNGRLDEEILYGVHESGLRVYIIPKKGFSKSYAIYATQFGSIDDVLISENGKISLPDGTAHFLEHKLFEEEGGKNAFDLFALTGASSNAFTSFDITAYLFACTDNFYKNLDILLEFVNNPYFTDENVAKEQGIIGQEIKMYEDDPSWRVFFNMVEAMYEKNTVRKDIAGTVESISHITPELLYKCCEKYYNPSNMLLCMVGDINPGEAEKYINKHVKASAAKPEKRRVSGENGGTVKKYVSQKLSVSKPIFIIGFKEKAEGECGETLFKKQIRTQILMEVLFGRSSCFYEQLYNEGLIDGSFDKETELEQNYGFSSVSGESKNPKEVYERALEYIDDVKKNGLCGDDIERAKKMLIGKNLRRFNSVERLGNDFIRFFMNGFAPLDYDALVENMSQSELEERLVEHFDREYSVLSVVEPE